HKALSLGQIEQSVKDKGITFAHIIQVAMVLTGAGNLALVQDDHVINKAKKSADKLNTHLCQKARGSHEIGYLASPVTGGGFNVNRFQQLFLTSIAQGKKQPTEWAQFAWQTIASQGQKLLKEGKALETAEENLAELTGQAQVFAKKQLPILKALQIA
ncbi:MAG TPA: methyltransferase, partial [Pseudomonadales bacterium]